MGALVIVASKITKVKANPIKNFCYHKDKIRTGKYGLELRTKLNKITWHLISMIRRIIQSKTVG